MSIIVELPANIELALSIEAVRRGLTPEQLAAEDLESLYAGPQLPLRAAEVNGDDMPKTGAELLAIMKRAGLFLPADQREERQDYARWLREEAWRRS